MDKICDFKDYFEELIEEILQEDIEKIDAHELGEVVDCLKDIYEIIYWKSMMEQNTDK